MKLRKLLYIFCILLCFTLVFPLSFSMAEVDASSVTVNAPVAILMEANTGKIVYEKGIHERMYPASTTKIMTAIIALENCELDDVAKVSYNAIFSVPKGYTNANLQLDEELTIEQLLYALLIPSANDAANVIAEHVAGSVESFANMMNTKAHELGCNDTHFVNANGVHDDDHYSTAYDLAIMGRYAMKNETFRKIVSTTRYTLPATNKYDNTDRIFVTTNKLVNSKSGQYYEYAIGTKTGYTATAKNCIVASAKKDNLEWICVILGANSDNNNSTNKFSDCISLFDFGFNNYSYKKLCEKDGVYKVVTPINSTKETRDLNVLYDSDLYALVSNFDTLEDFVPEVELDSKIKAPITKRSVIGKISYNIYGINYTTNLVAGQDVSANSIFVIILKIAAIIVALCIFKVIFNFLSGGKSYKRKRGKHRKSRSSYISPYRLDF